MSKEQPVKALRSLALDALRGLAIIGMILSGATPHGLPRWMSHAQVGPPTYKYDAAISGITWVDLVFPFFIFALGAAIPFAMRSRLEKGWPQWQAVLSLIKRWLLLCAFAIFQGQTGPWGYAAKVDESAMPFLWTLLAFAAMFLALWRTPDSWKPSVKWVISLSGWALGLAMFYFVPLVNNQTMSVEKNNVILWILANLAMLTGFAWMLTRQSFTARYWMMGAIVAFSLGGRSASWAQSIPIWFDYSAFGWTKHYLDTLLQPGLIAYLGIALPGTIAGELLQQWMRGQVKETTADAKPAWSTARMWTIVAVGLLMSIVTCSYTLMRQVDTGLIICVVLGIAGWWLVNNAKTGAEITVRKFFMFGAALLSIGYIIEPMIVNATIGGGVKKDPSTLSYFYLTAGLAFYMLSSLLLMIDVMGWRKPFALVIGSGQNPMIAYVAGSFFWTPVLGILGLSSYIQTKIIDGQFYGLIKISVLAWGTIWAVVYTLLVMVFATVCSKFKIFWRT